MKLIYGRWVWDAQWREPHTLTKSELPHFVLRFVSEQQRVTTSRKNLGTHQDLAICHWWRRAIDGAILAARKARI